MSRHAAKEAMGDLGTRKEDSFSLVVSEQEGKARSSFYTPSEVRRAVSSSGEDSFVFKEQLSHSGNSSALVQLHRAACLGNYGQNFKSTVTLQFGEFTTSWERVSPRGIQHDIILIVRDLEGPLIVHL